MEIRQTRLCMGCMAEVDRDSRVCPHCGYVRGTQVEAAYYLTPETMLSHRYIVGRVLGYGGFGVTYIGYDSLLKQTVAVKEYFPGEYATRGLGYRKLTVYPGEAGEQFIKGLESFMAEARRLAKLADTPGIVRIYDCFQENETGYIVMEFLKGKNIRELLRENGRLAYREAEEIMLEVLDALAAVHREGMVHRDIAPDNIFKTENGEIKLLDFGAARYAASIYSRSLSVILKPGYAPEEQYRSHGAQGPWTDVYAAGATFYRIITGKKPEEALERMVEDTLKPPSALGVEIPPEKEAVLMRSLEVYRSERIQTAEEFAKQLRQADKAAETEGLSETGDQAPVQNKGEKSRFPKWGFALSAVLLAAAAIGLAAAGPLLKGSPSVGEPKRADTEEETESESEMTAAKEETESETERAAAKEETEGESETTAAKKETESESETAAAKEETESESETAATEKLPESDSLTETEEYTEAAAAGEKKIIGAKTVTSFLEPGSEVIPRQVIPSVSEKEVTENFLSWIGGVDNISWAMPEGISGAGESVEYIFDGEEEVSALRLFTGYWSQGYPYGYCGRPKKLTIEFDTRKCEVEIPDADCVHYIVFDERVTTKSAKILVDEIYEGTDAGMVIADLGFWSPELAQWGGEALADMPAGPLMKTAEYTDGYTYVTLSPELAGDDPELFCEKLCAELVSSDSGYRCRWEGRAEEMYLYDKILAEYLSVMEGESGSEEQALEYLERGLNPAFQFFQKSDLGIAFADLDDNGVPEMLIGPPYSGDNGHFGAILSREVYEIYTVENGNVVRVLSKPPDKLYLLLSDDGRLASMEPWGRGLNTAQLCEFVFDGDELSITKRQSVLQMDSSEDGGGTNYLSTSGYTLDDFQEISNTEKEEKIHWIHQVWEETIQGGAEVTVYISLEKFVS